MAPMDALPNEVLSSILDLFTTRELVPLTLTCCRFRSIIAGLFHLRIRRASSLPDHALIVECYHETARLSSPSLGGRFVRAVWDGGSPGGADMASVSRRYSIFQPYEVEVLWPQVDLEAAATDDPPTESVFLDEGEQSLELITKALISGTMPGLFPVGEGVVRVSRKWLTEGSAPVRTEPGQHVGIEDDGNILWTDEKKNLGIQFRVKPSRAVRMPVLVGADDLPPVTYTLEYAGFVVRSRLLLLAVEESTAQHVEFSVNALVAFAFA